MDFSGQKRKAGRGQKASIILNVKRESESGTERGKEIGREREGERERERK